MLENPLPLIMIFELIAALLATIYYSKYADSTERYFVYFLWFVFLVEASGAVLNYVFSAANWWLYDGYMVISFLFYFFWYHSILEKLILRKMILLFSLLFIIVASANHFVFKQLEYDSYTFVTGALFTLVCAIFHFWQLLYSDEVLEIKHRLGFWISAGLLLFNIGMIPLMLLSKYLQFSNNVYYWSTIIALNFILYGCYSIGFLWTREKHSRS